MHERRHLAREETSPAEPTYKDAFNRFVTERGIDIEAARRANRVPSLVAELDDDDGAIELPPELHTFIESIFGQKLLCERVTLVEDSFALRMQTVRATYLDDDIVYVTPKDRELPIGLDKDVVFEVDSNTCHVGIYNPPFEFNFSGWQSNQAPFDVATVGKNLIKSVDTRVNSTIVLHKSPPQETQAVPTV